MLSVSKTAELNLLHPSIILYRILTIIALIYAATIVVDSLF